MTPDRRNALLAFAFLAMHAVAASNTAYDPDLFHVLALARETAELGRLPLEDHFAYTPTRRPVVHHEWGTAMLLYDVTGRFGATGLLWLKYALHLGTLAVALGVAHAGGARLATIGSLAPLGIALCTPGLTTLRAQVLTLGFVAILLALLEQDRRGSRRWILPYLVLHVVWLNCHGGFVVGLLLLGAHAVEQWLRRRPARHVVLVLVVATALIAANPYGTAYFTYLADALTMDRSAILEWLPLGAVYPAGLVAWGLAMLIFAYGVAKRGLRDSAGWLLVLVTALAALRAQRHVSIFGLVWLAQTPAIIAPTRLGATFDRLWSARPRLTTAVLVVALAVATARVVVNERFTLRLPANPGPGVTVVYPTGVVDYLRRAGFVGNVATPFDVGAFLTWTLHPAVRVSFDGRYEAAFDPNLLREHVALYDGGPGWRTVLDSYSTDAVLLRRDGGGARTMRNDGTWRILYEDDVWTLFGRPGLSLPYVDRRGARLPEALPAPGF